MDPILRSFTAQLGVGSAEELMVILIDQNFSGTGKQQSMTMEEFRNEINETAAKVVAKYLDNTNAGDVEKLNDIKDVIGEDVQNDLQRRKIDAKAAVLEDELAECVAEAIDEVHEEWLEFAGALDPMSVLSQHDLREFQGKQRAAQAGAIGMPWGRGYAQPDPRRSKPYYHKPGYGRSYRKGGKRKGARERPEMEEEESEEEETTEKVDEPEKFTIKQHMVVFPNEQGETPNDWILYDAAKNKTEVRFLPNPKIPYGSTGKFMTFADGTEESKIVVPGRRTQNLIFRNGWTAQIGEEIFVFGPSLGIFKSEINEWVMFRTGRVVEIPTIDAEVVLRAINLNEFNVEVNGVFVKKVYHELEKTDAKLSRFKTSLDDSGRTIFIGVPKITVIEYGKNQYEKTTTDFELWERKEMQQRLPGKWQSRNTSATLSDYSNSLKALAKYLSAHPLSTTVPLHFFAPTNESLAALQRLAPQNQRLDLDRIVQAHLRTPTAHQSRPANALALGRQRFAGHEVQLYGVSTVL